MESSKNSTILVVDDESDLREMLAAVIEKAGYRVLRSANGKEGLAKVKSEKIDAVVTDIRMPGGDGIELLNAVRQHNKQSPIVMFITGFLDLNIEEAYHKGICAIFHKPFERKVLLAAINRALLSPEERWREKPSHPQCVNTIRQEYESFNEIINSGSVNMGQGGMFFAAPQPWPEVESCVEFKIKFKSGELLSFEGRGVVRWVRKKSTDHQKAGWGIEFIYLSESSRSHIIPIINSLDSPAFIPWT